MLTLAHSMQPNDLKSAIIPNPLVVSASATVMEAIALMSSGRSQCDAENHSDNHQQQFQQEARSSCVLVLEDEKLIGIITERDVVRLSAQQQDLNRLLVREVMAQPVVTLRESDLTDLFLAVNLLQKYHIRHLPLLDDRDLLVGIVTHESLRQISRPIDLMRLRLVSEVMTADVVCAVSDRSMLAIAQMMAAQKISSVMIVDPSSTDASLQIPVGIVTERDVVQFQALGLNLETCIAHTVMSTPIFSVKPEDNLLTVQQIMEQRLIRRLAVTGEFGELLGIVTQTSLLQALNPTEMYNLAKVLEAKVEQLESEKVALLENRNIELERQVKERTASLSEAEKTLQKINQALELTVQERTQELWQVNKLQRAILDSTDYAIITTDYLSGIIQTFNAGAEKMLGYSMEEVVGKVTPEIFFDPQECIDRTSSISKEAGQNDGGFGRLMEIATQDILGQEWTNIRKDGSRFPVELSVRSLKDDEGQPIGFLSIRKDISDRKQVQEALKISEERFRNAFDTTAVGMCLVSPLGEFLKVNPALCNFLGYSETELLEMRFQEITHPDDLSTDLDLLSQLLAGEITHYNLEKRYFTKEQRFIWGYLSVSIVRNSQGELLYFVSQIQDISDRKVMEKNLEESRDKFQRLVDNMGEKFVVFSHSGVEGILSYVSDGAFPIFGLIKEDILGQPWSDVVNWLPEEIPNAEKRLLSMLQGEQDFYQSEMRFIHPDGSLRTIQVSEHPVRNETGEFLAIEGIVEDISDRKEAEQQLQNITDRLALALNSGAIGCWEWDIQRNLLVWDDRMYELYGELKATNFQIPYEIWSNAIHPDDRHATETLLQQAVLGQAEYDCEFRVIHPDRSVHFIKAYGKVTRDAQGDAQRMIGLNLDISDRKQAEQIILQQANRETLLRGITQRIRQSLDLSIIFDTACQEIQQLLQCDRVGIFKFYPESNFDDGEFVAESVVDGFSSAMEVHIHDHCFGEDYAAAYVQGRIQVVNDIDNAGLTDCHRDVLAQFQVRANLVIPLLCGNNLWGLLCIHQCAHTRQWQEHEINLIQQIANQLAIAIQQASLYEQLQKELLIRQQSQFKIARQLREQQTLATITNKIRESLSVKEILAVVTQQVKDVLSGDRAIVFQLFDNGNSQIVEESVHSNFPNLKALNWENEVWSQEILNCYWQGKPRIVPDVMNDIWTECLVEYSIEGQIKSKIIAPILVESHISENHRWVATEGSKKLWGVLVVHACAEPREWQDSEAQLLQQIANQLAIALQQASLYEQSQKEIAERKQAQQQLTESNQQLARATRLKDEFLANMSHELRTPLNSILGMNESLQDEVFGSINERQLKALRTIESSSTHLLALINDILDVAKIESGQVTLEITATDLDSLCKSSLAFIKQQALTKRIQLIHRIPKYLPEIMLDERRIRQVLINLLNNAVKFTMEGGAITLEVSQVQLESSPTNLTPLNYIKIAVIDTGIGISAENIQKLFQPFIQIDSALNRKYEGTGLGLALVKRLVELHGGNVELTSELGVGSCFAIALPLNIGEPAIEAQTNSDLSEQPQIGQSQTEELISPLILLAEDNEANIATFSSYLEARGYRILLANDGQQAIDLVKAHHPDLILMDIQMPVMDGLEAIKQIRLDPNLVDIPIIALTALAMEGDRERCLTAGANEYLSKPIKLKQLATIIQQIFKQNSQLLSSAM